jgi:uncharacterized pyridoxamine 5'-phosphate oxidase family protein
MNDFTSACAIMQKQLGHNVLISLATCYENDVSVRIVNGFYKDGAIYVVTHTSTYKMQQILKNPNVSVCKDLFQGFGIGENLGNPTEEKNRELAHELREVFISFYDLHVDENDSGTCILKIKLTKAVVFSDDSKYIIDYSSQTAEKFAFNNTIVCE